jgi:hypothetical protein
MIHDAHIGGALSTVGARSFGAGRVSAVAASHEQIGGAHMMAGNLPVVPSRASLSASGRAAAPSTIRNGGSDRFFGSHTAGHTESFDHETAGLRQSMAANHVGGFTAGGRSEYASRSTSAMTGAKPSAGSFSGREASNTGNRSAGSVARPFTPPSASGTNRSTSGFDNSVRNTEQPRTSESGSRDGFRSFTPPSQSSRSESGASSYGSSERGSSGSYWNRTAPNTAGRSYSDAYGRGSSGSYGSSRPQLDMRQPIAHGPSYGGYGGYSRPSYGGSRPSYGGSRSTPSYGGSHSSSSGSHVSAPSHSSGGGGGHPSGGGSHGGHR